MILTGKVSRTDGGTAKGPDSGMASGVDSGMAGDLDSGPGSNQLPGLAQPHSAHRRVVAVIVDGSGESVSALRQAASQHVEHNATLDVIYLLPEQADARAVTLARVRLASSADVPARMGWVRRYASAWSRAIWPWSCRSSRLTRNCLSLSRPGHRDGRRGGPGRARAHNGPPGRSALAGQYRHLMHPRGTWLNTLLHASS